MNPQEIVEGNIEGEGILSSPPPATRLKSPHYPVCKSIRHSQQKQVLQVLGQYMMTKTPIRQMAPPRRSNRSGTSWAINQPQVIERTTKIPP